MRQIKHTNEQTIKHCYTCQVKYVSRLAENVSDAMGQKSVIALGNIDLNFRLARDQVVHHETEADVCANRPDLKRMLRWLNRVMQNHEARASDLNRKLIFSFFLLFS